MMIPANIIRDFKTCGVYPFNLKAVLDHDPCVSRSHSSESSNGDLLSGSALMVKGDL